MSTPTTTAETLHLEQVLPNDGTSLRRPDANIVLTLLSRLLLRLMGWRIYGQLPAHDKFVLAAAPHTANMDGILMLMTAWAFRARADWMVKIELARNPFVGWLVHRSGGLPIDRRASRDAVEQVVERIQEREQIMVVISPEGTRKKTHHWKTGFYWIAHNAGVPIVCGFIDYKHKRVGVGPSFTTTGNIEADMQPIFDFYRQITPRYPELYSDMKLRPHNRQAED